MFNGDNFPDLVTTTTGVDGNVEVRLGNGDGTFDSALILDASSRAFDVVVGRFNVDGFDDLAVTSYDGNAVDVFVGNGDGTLWIKEFPPERGCHRRS